MAGRVTWDVGRALDRRYRPAKRERYPRLCPGFDDLSDDAHGDLSRGLGTDVEADRTVDSVDLIGAEAIGEQPLTTAGGSLGAAHRPDVGRRRRQDERPQRILEASVVAENDHIGSPIELHLDLVGPTDEKAIRIGEPFGGREGRSGIGDRDVETELARHRYQFLGDVDRPKDHEVGSRHDAFDVDLLGPVRQRQRALPIEQGRCIGDHVRSNLRRKFSRYQLIVLDDGRLTRGRTGDDRRPRSKLFCFDQPGDGIQAALIGSGPHHCSM